jgi:hypothetical protein
VRRHVADMAMFDLRAHPLHAARGFVLVPPDERGCRKTYGIGVKRTQILGMGCSTLKLDLWQGSLTCRRNGRLLTPLWQWWDGRRPAQRPQWQASRRQKRTDPQQVVL